MGLRNLLTFALVFTFALRTSAQDDARTNETKNIDTVTEQLIREYVFARGKISSTPVAAAVELVAWRGYGNTDVVQLLLAEFDQNPRTVLQVLSKMLARSGNGRWAEEQFRRSSIPQQKAQIATRQSEYPRSDRNTDAILESLIKRGRRATRSTIDGYTLAIRHAYHPRCKQFLLDVLQNPPNDNGKWSDNLGGSWRDAKFHAAIGLAELGEGVGIEWLIAHTHIDRAGGYIFNAPHANARDGSQRQSCLYALADLTKLSPERKHKEWQSWWSANKEHYRPARRVLLRVHNVR